MTAQRSSVTIAVAQVGCRLGDARHNLDVCLGALEAAAAASADLLVLPECALTGYLFRDRGEATAAALRLDGEEVASLARRVADTGLHAVVGLLEADGGEIYNTAVLLGPEGPIGRYRKAHVPPLGADRFVGRGSDLRAVWDTPIGRIGVAICYDIRFPESARVLALAGAEIVAQPSNVAVGTPEVVADSFVPVRACENSVFLAFANRCDEESGVRFCGKSSIAAPDGTLLAVAAGEPALLLAEADLSLARSKRRDIVADGRRFAVELFGDRRPDLYGELSLAP